MIRQRINESRAAKGQNAMPTGNTGKGSIHRISMKPNWVGLEEIRRDERFVVFRSGISSKRFVPLHAVLNYEKKTVDR